jgi:hypothetical protein
MFTLDLSSASILALGALHGINPSMGWLFAVSLGLQAGSGRAVWRALGPLALGHALAIAAALLAAALLGIVLPLSWVRWTAAIALLGFGVFQLVRHRHPGRGGMNVGARDLTVWSFLMASAHGAGLMVLPFVLGLSTPEHSAHAAHLAATGSGAAGVVATLLHTASYLAVAGMTAWIVYSQVGLRFLRSAWVNLNAIWAVALVITAVVTPLL